MSDGKVEFHIGPVASDVALAWIDNAKSLIGAVRGYRAPLTIDVRDEILELCDTLLDMWDDAARNRDTFEWTFAMSGEVVAGVIEQWLQIGALSDEELCALGASWAPEWTRPMADALTAAVIALLPQFDTDTKRRFAERLEPGIESAE